METLDPRNLRLAVNTQTPLVRFRDGSWTPTTGGVVRMLHPLLRRWQEDGTVRSAEWVSMSGDDQTHRLKDDAGVELTLVGLSEAQKKGYAVVKERMWALLNSNPSTPVPFGEGGIPSEAWEAFDAYQIASADALLQASERMGGIDLLYIHDFQQIGVAEMWKGPRVPMVFHLHTPFPSVLPAGWAEHFVARLRRYDAVIVSTKRYADNLRAAGLDTAIHVVHPFIDPASYPTAAPGDAAKFRERFGIAESDRVILNVARMDPMKGQDRLIRAMPHVLEAVPDARLVLVGNGSFSSARKGGLGLDKGKQWRAQLEALAEELGVAHRVTFTGHVDDEDLPAAYDACEIFSLPSTREGFGLAAIEAWRHRKPVIVSDRAGVSELVVDDVNGAALDCGDTRAVAEAILRMLRDPAAAQGMGEVGLETSRAATLDVGGRALKQVFASVLEARRFAIA
ncbi:MAG TPA: glycosyltransferase family 4 protein [Candidatus Thermoplasmatota archaeon]|nr:glycosyltransferase family 4 protein [Candidatus Thermoplasmatota archaeon]